jgi:hypothetical protein
MVEVMTRSFRLAKINIIYNCMYSNTRARPAVVLF